ncbi:MAG TPA: peptidylprolyl isomerase [Pseudonocardiaceae bacterium]|jgi:cyclophilin family peptidyl-prolyl cis-trans isomerase|nr:peptidylprolyl isomerase [Pseudonocardiaceae bacterium]
MTVRGGMIAGAVGMALIGMLAAGCGTSTNGSAASSNGTAGSGTSGTAGGGATGTSGPTGSTPAQTTGTAQCAFTATPSQPAPAGHDEGTPPSAASRAGTVMLTLHTSQGDIPITMPRAKAPCTVASFAFLAGKGYFTNTPCHRLTSADSLKVLQCGDPTGSGTGGPGYTIPDENPTDLPLVPGGGASVYARGTVAMANTGQPHSGGSQFFLVYADSALPPNYAVFGSIAATGLQVLDKIAAGGVGPGGQGPQDGPPATPVKITSATVAGG